MDAIVLFCQHYRSGVFVYRVFDFWDFFAVSLIVCRGFCNRVLDTVIGLSSCIPRVLAEAVKRVTFFCEICCKKFENYQKNVFVTPNQRTKRKTRHFFSVFHSPLNQNLSLKTKVRYCTIQDCRLHSRAYSPFVMFFSL